MTGIAQITKSQTVLPTMRTQRNRDGLCACRAGKGEKLMYKGEEYEADHWNILLTATKDDATAKEGYRVHLFTREEAEAALKEYNNGKE